MKFATAVCLTLCFASIVVGQQEASIEDSLRFLASFDQSVDADRASGDGRLRTATNLKRDEVEIGLVTDAVKWSREKGRYGGCLSFQKKVDAVVFFEGAANLPETKAGFEGTISFWMRLTPNEDLPPGYVDPLQITDKQWNDASFFVDFTDKNPRQFRLGVFSNYAFWNPDDRKWDDIQDDERPLVTVKQPPFDRDTWTHVGITFSGFNRENQPGQATLYLNGKSQGTLRRPQQITWEPEKLAIMLGIYYVGDLDEFAVFDRCLSEKEVREIAESDESLTERLPGLIHKPR